MSGQLSRQATVYTFAAAERVYFDLSLLGGPLAATLTWEDGISLRVDLENLTKLLDRSLGRATFTAALYDGLLSQAVLNYKLGVIAGRVLKEYQISDAPESSRRET